MGELRGFCVVFADGPTCQSIEQLLPLVVVAFVALVLLAVLLPLVLKGGKGGS